MSEKRETCGAIREIGCGKKPGHKLPHWWDAATPDELAAAEERGRLAAAVMCKCGDELQPDDGAICGACLQPEIAEAEERGRRRGVEEREELRLVLWDALAVIQSRAPDMTVLIPRIRAALAPRDSAPCPEPPPGTLEAAEASARRGGQIGCGNLATYQAPRDSGKETK